MTSRASSAKQKTVKPKKGSSTIYLNLTAAKALVDQLSLANLLAKNLKDNQIAEIDNIFCQVSEICYTFYTGQPQVIAKDSADGVLEKIAAAGANVTWNIVNFVLEKDGLTHAGANLQGVGNVGDGAGPLSFFYHCSWFKRTF